MRYTGIDQFKILAMILFLVIQVHAIRYINELDNSLQVAILNIVSPFDFHILYSFFIPNAIGVMVMNNENGVFNHFFIHIYHI